ncbi:glutathione hydrolase 1 isoform X1 [Ziziphus jujuba]|uniref:Glutathione hydrolase n=2 Tax=Ziziphus jujuba TaxID=326968 RepID=A0ABM3ITM7_ZIZJJ|nr:glutathione hydrolase 1-like isoform X1 [Ziziphus jujuba var. spinosa]XP_048335232.2 glutathione hydrolase 1 isoform X1 [Ziziphus jujuba]
MERKIIPHYPMMLWPSIAIFFLSLLLLTSSLDAASADSQKNRNEVIVAQNGAVATDDGRCSRIGMNVLREGGHAVDAAVAASLCLGVVNQGSSGIGGGAFMLIRESSGEAEFFDMRETAPLLSSKDMYGGNATLKSKGGLSIAVPGELAGLHKAWKKYGKLPWKRLVKPAESLARLGFKISPYLHFLMQETKAGVFEDEGLRDIYTSNGSLLKQGDICYNKKLAETLKIIADEGIQPFYNGSIGFNLVRDIRKAGGIITMKDLQSYKVKVRKPNYANFQGLEYITSPLPSGGPLMILMLNILALYGNLSGVPDSLFVHREIEALKHAFAVRMTLGDPDFVNVTEVLSDTLSIKFAEELKETIYDNMTFPPKHYGGKWNQLPDHGTSHLSIVDKERNSVSMTTTVNLFFGSQILSPSTGIVLNNEMDDFSMPANVSKDVPPPAPANFISPGKRPLSSMSPTIVLKNKRLKAVIGASGGSRIFPGTAQVFLNHFARGMDPFSSVFAPRIYHQLIPNKVNYENWTTVIGDYIELPASIREDLHKKGHVLEPIPSGAICQFITLEAETTNKNGSLGKIVAVSDPRKGGIPSGY